MNTIDKLLSERPKDEIVFHTWQFALARRVAQILEEKNITQRRFAEITGLTDAQVSALLHGSTNPTLHTLSKISGLLETDVLSFVNNEFAVSAPLT